MVKFVQHWGRVVAPTLLASSLFHPTFGHQEHRRTEGETSIGFERCGTRTPSLEESQAMEEAALEWKTANNFKAEDSSSITICTYVHVMEYADGSGGVTDKQVSDQIEVLNKHFAGEDTTDFCGETSTRPNSGSAATPFHFELSLVTRTQNNEWANWTRANERVPKSTIRRGDQATLNLYVAPQLFGFFTNILGYAKFPFEYEVDPILDGVVLLAGTFPGGDKSPYNEGDTATHEVGHWLNLFHTFQDGCEGGDLVDDTEPEETAAYGCNVTRNSCGDEDSPLDPVTNFMDYSDDCCLFRFSEGQKTRMVQAWNMYRTSESGDDCTVVLLPTASTPVPSATPNNEPSIFPSSAPSERPSNEPSSSPSPPLDATTPMPSGEPSSFPSSTASESPSNLPSSSPTSMPSAKPTSEPPSVVTRRPTPPRASEEPRPPTPQPNTPRPTRPWRWGPVPARPTKPSPSDWLPSRPGTGGGKPTKGSRWWLRPNKRNGKWRKRRRRKGKK